MSILPRLAAGRAKTLIDMKGYSRAIMHQRDIIEGSVKHGQSIGLTGEEIAEVIEYRTMILNAIRSTQA